MDTSGGAGHLTTEALYRQHAGFVARFLARLGVHPEQLEDALQEVFLVVHRNGGYRPGIAKPTSYLANMAIYAAAKQRQKRAAALKKQKSLVDLMPADATDPDQTLQTRRDMERLERALAELPEELRTTLLLVDLEGESCVSVAAGLNCPVGTVYSRLHTARKRLQQALRPNAARARAKLDEHASPARALAVALGVERFHTSETKRLLQLAREQQLCPQLRFEALFERLQALQQSAAVPAWASHCAPPTSSWFAILGAPLTTAATASIVLAGAVLFAHTPHAPDPELPAEARSASLPQAPHSAQASPHSPESDWIGQRVEPSEAAARAPTAPREANRSARRSERARRFARTRSQVQVPTTVPEATSGAVGSSHDANPSNSSTASPQAAAAPGQAAEPQQDLRAPDPPPAPAEKAAAVPTPAPGAGDAELAELRNISEAERLLAREPARTLELTRKMQTRFADGNLREERAYLELMALHNLGRGDELRAHAAEFLQAYPSGIYSERVKKLKDAARQ